MAYGIPRKIIIPSIQLFGRGAASKVGSEIKQRRGSKVLIVTDPQVLEARLVDPIVNSLEESGIDFVIFSDVEPDPSVAIVEKAVDCIRKGNFDAVIGLGGGSSLDVAKAAGAVAPLEGEVRDYLGFVDEHRVDKKVTIILVATTSGTGSEMTQAAILTDEKSGVKTKLVGPRVLADVAVVDPLLTVTMPKKVTIDTGLDAFVHGLEAYLSKNRSPLTDLLAKEAIRLVVNNLPRTAFAPDDLDAREAMCLAAAYGGIACTNAGLGAVHALTYPLSKLGLSHGRANAVMLPHVMSHNLPADFERYAAVASLITVVKPGTSMRESARLALDKIRDLLDDLGVSANLRDYGVEESHIEEMAGLAFTSGQHLLSTNPRKFEVEDARIVYKQAWWK